MVYTKSQNNSHWCTEHSHAIHEVLLHDLKLAFSVEKVKVKFSHNKS